MTIRKLAGAVLTLTAALPSSATIAAEVQPTVVVTGRGLGADRADRAYDVSVIDRARIDQSASKRLEDVLRDVAGLQGFRRSDSRSANATSQSITMRGLGGNASSRALLILDGVPQTDPFGGWVSFPFYSTERIGRIKVTRGGGGALFGPGALAGTVEIDSVTPDQVPRVAGVLAYGSRDALDARGSLALKSDAVFVTATSAFARGDGFVPIVAADRGPVDRRAGYRQASGALRAVVAIGGRAEAQASLAAFDDRRDRGLPNTDNRGTGVDGSLRLVSSGAMRWSLLGYVQRRRFESQSAAVNAARTTATLTNDQYQVPSRGWGARGEIVPLSGEIELRLGGDLRAVEGESRELFQFVAGAPTRRRIAGGEALTFGGFADATFVRRGLTASVSGRIDRWRLSNGSLSEAALTATAPSVTAYEDRSGWQPTARAAIAHELGGGVTARVAGYRGWRLATLNELHRPFRVGADATAANAALRPETLVGAEAGGEWRFARRTSASATLFAARLDDAIANVTIARGPGTFPGVGFVSAAGSYRRRENLERIATRGLELGVEAGAGAFAGRLSYSLVDARVHDSGLGAALDGKRPAQTPRHQASATLAYTSPRGLDLSLTGRAFSGQFEDDLNTRRLKGAVTIDAAAQVPLGKRLAIALRGENLLDRRVETTLAADGVLERSLPRTLWLEFRLK